MLYHISNLSQIPLEKSLLVEDSIKDEGAAKNANIDFLLLLGVMEKVKIIQHH